MADQPIKKTVSTAIRRERPFQPKTLVVTGFKLRIDKVSGVIDVLLEASGQKGERIIFDPVLLRTNLDTLKKFAASSKVDPDDSAQKEEVSVSETPSFANILHFSRMGDRGETTFAVFSLYDWVEATRPSTGEKATEIKSYDNVVAVSTAAIQKKLILEIILSVSQLFKE